MDSSRTTILHNLVWLSAPLSRTRLDLADFGWDSDDALVFGVEPVVSVLDRYVEDEISGDTVVLWAEMIESREDIEFRTVSSLHLVDVIYELANPDLEGPLTSQRAAEILKQLRAIP